MPPRVLFLGPDSSPLLDHVDAELQTTNRVAPDLLERLAPDFVVSFGYRHILPAAVIDLMPDRIINLHIALLPFNRGADPNLWSWIEGTPKGVTIHHIDPGVDTGDIIAQREVDFTGTETLASSYELLQAAMVDLFIETWPAIVAGTAPRIPQPVVGTYHRVADRDRVEHLITGGWATPVRALEGHRPDVEIPVLERNRP